MSKNKKSGKKKVVVTSTNTKGKTVVTSKKSDGSKKSKLKPTTSKSRSSIAASSAQIEHDLIFDKKNYMLMLSGVALMALGFLLMLGGNMPSPDVWEPERIYSFRRITLAPMLILAGLGLEVYAIFKKY